MALKPWWPAGLLLILLGAACTRAAAPPPPAAEDERPGLSVTRWTDRTELFAEFPALTVGEVSRFAIHLTRLDPFKAVTEGQVDVVLQGGGAPDEVFQVDRPSRPGIFGVDVSPRRAGPRTLLIRLRSTGLEDVHRVGEVTVYGDATAARAAAASEEDEATGISFLKEQQWTLDFGTALVSEGTVRESMRVPAVIEARPGGTADVAAPIDGRLASVAPVTPGTAVAAGQELARVQPPAQAPGDLPQLQRAVAEATTALAVATHDRGRAERLVAAGAAPARRVEEARAVEDQARARLTAAEGSLANYDAARTGSVTGRDGLFAIRAPIAGVVASREATSGANVEAGTVLFRVVQTDEAYVVGQVPETDAARVRQVAGAEIEVPGWPDRVPVTRLVSIGKVIDPRTRTLPITFTLDNRAPAIPIGQTVGLHVLMRETASRAIVPATAIVDDAGRPIVFVQREGETFERRPVTIGPRRGDRVQVLEGLKPGERVVTRGAYLVRLASLSTSVPAHGHVH